MKKIKSQGTKPEIALCKALWHTGIRYRKNYTKLPGKPDIVIMSKKIAIFVDGELWHGYNWEDKKNKIRSNRDYWIPKIERTMSRDIEYNHRITEMGWKVIRYWENDIRKNLPSIIEQIKAMLLET